MSRICLETSETTVHCWVCPHWALRALCCCAICALHNVWSGWRQRGWESPQDCVPGHGNKKQELALSPLILTLAGKQIHHVLAFHTKSVCPMTVFPFFSPQCPHKKPLGVCISIMCSVLHWGVRGISCPSVLCQMAQIMCSASSGGILISSALVHGSGVGLVPAQLSPGVSDKHATCGSEQCFEVVLLCQILIRDENVFENDGRKMCCSSLDKTLWGSVCYVEQPEVRSGPAAIWQLRKGSRDVELRPLTAESKTKSLLLRGRVKSHFCLRARFICTIKWLCLWLVEKHAII